MLLLIGSVQLVITLVDYQFNAVAEQTFTNEDELAATLGRVAAIINASAVVLQLATGPVLKLLGVGLTLIAIPVLLGGSLGTYLIAPHFAVLAVGKILSKCLDYSLFRAAKEILYIPLGHTEKTEGKAAVDMLTYRVAKGLASLTVLALVSLAIADLVGAITVVLIGGWIALSVSISRQHRARLTPPEA
jgi:AAA family ATP:ADP antiporter